MSITKMDEQAARDFLLRHDDQYTTEEMQSFLAGCEFKDKQWFERSKKAKDENPLEGTDHE